MNKPGVTVLGAGTMGFNIARCIATHGFSVTVYDSNPAAMERSEKRLNELKKATGDNVCFSHERDLSVAISDADFVIESISEDLLLKRDLYFRISPLLKDENVIVSSNTSTFRLDDLSVGLSFKTRMVITHFFNPAHLIPLVEIVRPRHISSLLVKKVVDLLTGSGKVPIILNSDIEGFIANRLQAALVREACYLVQAGIADPLQIDTVVKESIGIRWALSGPFEIMDRGGLDIWEKVLKNLLPRLDAGTQVPAIMQEKVSANNLGRKSGLGFYKHNFETSNRADERYEGMLVHLLAAKKGNG